MRSIEEIRALSDLDPELTQVGLPTTRATFAPLFHICRLAYYLYIVQLVQNGLMLPPSWNKDTDVHEVRTLLSRLVGA